MSFLSLQLNQTRYVLEFGLSHFELINNCIFQIEFIWHGHFVNPKFAIFIYFSIKNKLKVKLSRRAKD